MHGEVTQSATMSPPVYSDYRPCHDSNSATVPATPATSYQADGYNIVGKPTINAAFIDKILTRYHSPAAGKGQALYNAGVKAHIDPIFALAFFMHDSIFGTVGMARVTRSLGNLPAPGNATCRCQDFHGYRQYASWEAGFSDWYQFIQSHYVSQGVTTIGQIVPDYCGEQRSCYHHIFYQNDRITRRYMASSVHTTNLRKGGTSLSLSSLLG